MPNAMPPTADPDREACLMTTDVYHWLIVFELAAIILLLLVRYVR